MDSAAKLSRSAPGTWENVAGSRVVWPSIPRSFSQSHSLSRAPRQVRPTWPLLLGAVVALLGNGCRTDQAAQDHINQMRAEQIAIEDRYAALRNEYEKLRNRLAAQGDPEAKSPAHPSALPLSYPPGAAPLDDLSLDAAWGQLDSDGRYDSAATGSGLAVPDLRSRPSVLESSSGRQATGGVPHRLLVRHEPTPPASDRNAPFVVRLIVTPVGQEGRPAKPDGTYTLRLSDPTKLGRQSEVGYWHFPPEAVRTFLQRPESIQLGDGIPLEVAVRNLAQSPVQWLAELEFHSVTGQRLESREILNFSPHLGNQTLGDWAGQLPVPTGVHGLMTSGHPTGSNSPPPPGQWRPER